MGVSFSRFRIARLALVSALALVAVALLAAGGQAAPAGTAANSATFPDSTGEDPAGPDIVSVAVSNDNAGMITFQVNVPNRPELTGDMIVVLFFDADDNPSSGGFGLGIDHVIELDGPLQGPAQIGLFRWNGSDFTSDGVSQTSLRFSYANGAAAINISASELGAGNRIKFAAEVDSGIVLTPEGEYDFTNARYDLAPDPGHGLFAYDVKIGTPTLRIVRVATQPARPAAGKPYAVAASVKRSDGAATPTGRTTCRATVGGRTLRPRASAFRAGVGACAFKIPAGTSGKLLRVTITVTTGGLKATRTFSTRIR